jgi:hypothetical protein
MKKTLSLVAILATLVGTAAAQTAGGHPGGTGTGANGNNNVSSGNSSNTSSSAANNNPTTAAPNYKPAAKPRGTGKDTKAPAAAGSKTTVVRSGGQGHNTEPDPKGKTLVAPSATTSGKKQ